MEVVHRLAGVITAIEDRPKATSRDSHLSRNVLGRRKQVRKNSGIFPSDIQYIDYMFAWDNQDMYRCLGCNIFKRKDILIFKNFVCGERSLNNFAEDTLFRFYFIIWFHAGRIKRLDFYGK